jgi:hypothetical protein
MVDNGYLLYFRWLELLAEPRKDSGQIRPAQQPPPPPPNLAEVMA